MTVLRSGAYCGGLAVGIPLLNVLMNPIDEYVCKVEVVVVHHQHMAVAVDSQVVRKREEGRISAGLLKSSNCGLAA